mmetsp:Transcript_947/g.823  ORF Transcript_947/g.823 Transcript_947/m.823 type:complete len:177 (-) Transcript_947:44-574(-)
MNLRNLRNKEEQEVLYQSVDPKKVTNKIFLSISKPQFFCKKESTGWNPTTKKFNFKEMPKEIKIILKAANIKKRHLNNADVASKTFDIIQKALSFHSLKVIDMFKKRRESVTTDNKTVKDNYTSNKNVVIEDEENEESKSSIPKPSLKPTNVIPAGRASFIGGKLVAIGSSDMKGS